MQDKRQIAGLQQDLGNTQHAYRELQAKYEALKSSYERLQNEYEVMKRKDPQNNLYSDISHLKLEVERYKQREKILVAMVTISESDYVEQCRELKITPRDVLFNKGQYPNK